MNKNILKDGLIIGFALFAIFFGAGNLIFPPSIGFNSGSSWPVSLVGLLLTGVILPVLGVIAVANSGGSFASLTRPISNWFHKVFCVAVMVGVGVFFSVPRTSAVTYEMSIKPLFPSIPSAIPITVFFGLTYYFANNKYTVIDRIGKIISPFKLLFLLFIVVMAVMKPIGIAVAPGIAQPFSNAFTTAYQTGDVLTGLLIGSMITAAILRKGYTRESDVKNVTRLTALVAAIFLAIVYSGFLFLGASASSLFPKDIEKTALLLSCVQALLGSYAAPVLGLTVALACLTTSVGLTAATCDFLTGIVGKWISYKQLVTVCCVIGITQGILGVEKIIFFAVPIFLFIYPSAIALVFMGLFFNYIPNKGSFRGVIAFSLLFGLFDAVGFLGVKLGAIGTWISMIPLSKYGFPWIIPSIIGFFVGTAMYKLMPSKDLEIVQD